MSKKSREERKTEQEQRRYARLAARQAARYPVITTVPRPVKIVPPLRYPDNITFSLVLPSRERVDQLTGLLQSVVDTTNDLNRVDVWVGIDDDDSKTHRALNEIRSYFPFVAFQTGERGNNMSQCYYNLLAASSSGKYVLLLNDDTTFTAKNWDTQTVEMLERFKIDYPDNVLLARTADDTGCAYSCFPMLSREAINLLGYIQPPTFPGWGSDIALHNIFSAVGRELFIPLAIHHHCIHNGSARRDEVSKRMGRLSQYPWRDIDRDKERVRDFLAGQVRVSG